MKDPTKPYARRRQLTGVIVTTMIITAIVVGALTLSHTGPATAGRPDMSQKADTPAPQTPTARAFMDNLSTLFEQASDNIGPSVVPIFSEQVVQMSNSFGGPNDLFHQFFGDEFERRFFGNQERKQTVRGLGSGVIVSEDGLILTNNHVVKDAEKLTVVLGDKKKYEAKVIGTDPSTDVAVIKIDAHGLPAAKLGDSDNVKVGEWVIAVGNPFQLMHTVTAGIISAKGRSSIGLAQYEDFIQTDASINPGNSGGALCDLDGNVIGINTAISSPSGANAGIGFAIPINMARKVMDALIDNGKVSRGFLALVPQDISDDLAKAMHLDSTNGALVGDVTPDGPADKAGVKRGDVIVAFNGNKVEDSTELRNEVAEAKPGSDATLTVVRDGHKKKLEVKLGERPEQVASNETNKSSEDNTEKMGVQVTALTPDVAQQLGYEHAHGVVVTGVEPGSPAESSGLRRGDLIEQVDHKDVDSVKDFSLAVSNLQEGDSALLLTRRGDYTFFVAVPMS